MENHYKSFMENNHWKCAYAKSLEINIGFRN